MLLLGVLTFGLALWLGAYLISRNPRDVRLLLAGAGLVFYALAVALATLVVQVTESATAERLLFWQRIIVLLPAAAWVGLLVHFLRGDEAWYSRLQQHPRPRAVVLAATIFFGLGVGLVLFPLTWVPPFWMLLAIGVDLVLLGVTVAVLDAFDEGESLRPHFLRSFESALLLALLFGGQVLLVMWLSGNRSAAMVALLLGTVAAAILVATFAVPLQRLADRLAVQAAGQRAEQSVLREAASAAPRRNAAVDPLALEEEEFVRLTRRALSHMGDLPRLSTSPLTHLPLVEARLQEKGIADGVLPRANELKAVLQESITRLKPRGAEAFGTTDEWRHYNALYFPYVAGLKPYSRRATHDTLDEAEAEALVWLQAQVPPRTLYNWQNAAAALIAQDLRERGNGHVAQL